MIESEGLTVRRFAGEPPPVVALHGFTQTGAVYAELAGLLGREVLAPDLPGHGQASGRPASFGSVVKDVSDVLASVKGPVPLIGYSQGGRVALGAALQTPELVSHLVLVSASAGIEDAAEREMRRRSDASLAAELRNSGLPSFLDAWLGQTMFKGLQRRDENWRIADRAARLENTADGLVAALAGMGQGSQPYFGERLIELTMPVLLLVGLLDEKYVSIATAMATSLPKATLRIISDAGHAVIGEQPRIVAGLIERFLTGSE
jgi:2-succinyl-6-hydroxy-2,4-cyclohexadiene-1-carboxylate synthase